MTNSFILIKNTEPILKWPIIFNLWFNQERWQIDRRETNQSIVHHPFIIYFDDEACAEVVCFHSLHFLVLFLILFLIDFFWTFFFKILISFFFGLLINDLFFLLLYFHLKNMIEYWMKTCAIANFCFLNLFSFHKDFAIRVLLAKKLCASCELGFTNGDF